MHKDLQKEICLTGPEMQYRPGSSGYDEAKTNFHKLMNINELHMMKHKN